ncbi:ParB/RepB/Spo0J family partition protein [Streptomyces sp. ME01-18h]|uniref:ParB/RepB/Spo0J family partition protein n=1 Tax=Streptomyces sp. ME01-18h TaxID=462920 RepID=UPI0029A2EBEB|nr:ParB/RepB/Spo0J family partition protein [Streptomyces sp. ME01-18h]MDX3403355.1 ParB/RepB/Spo0J family partition protein [Streptomyces sp. ME01-18h]
MSKADQLGAGRFGGGARSVSARRQAVAAATGVPTDGVAPPTELPPDHISLNPDNPRSSLGDLTDLSGSLKTHGQKQAITVMNRDAYVKANPEREADLEHDTTHVVIDGSSRLAAAREAGLATIKVMVSDDEGSTSEEILESALVANIHRQDLEELDEARALQRLLAIHGSQTALAKRLHRSQGWVSQRLALLHLTPELQARISHEPIDLLRAVGNKPAEEQEAALQALKEQRAKKEADRRRRRNDRAAGSGGAERRGGVGKADSHYDVIEDAAAKGAQTTLHPEARLAPAQGVPEPRADKPVPPQTSSYGTDGVARKVPYDEPGILAMLLDSKIESDDNFFALMRFLGRKAANRDPQRLAELLGELAQHEPEPAE